MQKSKREGILVKALVMPHAVLCPLLGSPVEERHEHTVNSPKKGHEHHRGTGASLLGGKTEGTGTFHFGEEKA